MSDLRTAAQQALEAMEGELPGWRTPAQERAITALRDALEQQGQEQEQEPVASIYVTIDGGREFDDWRCPLPVGRNFLYTHPPRREWQELTEEDIQHPHPPAKPPVYATAQNTKSVRDGFEIGGYEKEPGYYSEEQLDEFARAIEAAVKEKNA